MTSDDRPVIVRYFDSDYVFRYDHDTINNNNLYARHGRPQPADYSDCLSRLQTGNWIYRFHDAADVKTLILDESDAEWMQHARQIGRMTRCFSRIYEDELQETVAKHSEAAKFIEDGGWFVRTEYVSLKNGQYGIGPYDSLANVIKSLVTSNPGHDCFVDNDRSIKLYFLPFIRNLDVKKEFRVFVYDNQITAISQQALGNQISG